MVSQQFHDGFAMVLRWFHVGLRMVSHEFHSGFTSVSLLQDCLYHHPVHMISFIAQDMSDSRAFGYIYGSPENGNRFFGIKTEKAAGQVSTTFPIFLAKANNGPIFLRWLLP